MPEHLVWCAPRASLRSCGSSGSLVPEATNQHEGGDMDPFSLVMCFREREDSGVHREMGSDSLTVTNLYAGVPAHNLGHIEEEEFYASSNFNHKMYLHTE